MCLDESLDIRAAITNASADSDVWDATSISTFAVEGAQTATQILRCFRRCEESLGRIDVHLGLAYWRHEATYDEACPFGKIGCSNQSMLSLWFVQASIECSTNSGVRNSARLREVRIDKARRRGDKLQDRAHELP